MEQIKLEKIDKEYKGKNFSVRALSDVQLSVEKGEMIAVMGTSGSGKTTLLNILGLIDKPDAGSYFLDGTDVTEYSDSQLAKLRNRKIGFVLQDFGLLEQYTVEKNVQLPLRYSDIARKEWKEAVRTALESVGLSDKSRNYPSELSGGQKQRVAIARALITKADILLADEPTGALDSRTGREIMELFLRINGEGRTVIIVTHDAEIAKFCNRILIMDDGRLSG